MNDNAMPRQSTRTGRISRARATWLTPMAIVTAVMLAVLLFLMIFGPLIWDHAAEQPDTTQVFRPPSAAHVLGTDNLGRDILARVLVASRLSLLLAIAATLLGAVAGIVLGAATAVVETRIRRMLGAVINLMLAFPGLLVAVFFAVIFGANASGAVFALAIAYTPGFARITQTLAAGITDSEYVGAARILGLRRPRILLRHVLPNIAEPLALNLTTAAGATLVALSGLSFLGLGVQSPSYDWGLLLNQGLNRIYVEPMPALAPGIAILFAGLAFQLLGEVLAGSAARRTRFRHQNARRATTAAPTITATQTISADSVLGVEDLTVSIPTPNGTVHAVRGVSLQLAAGEIVGIVGESGSGKSLTALALADLLPAHAEVNWRAHRFLGQDIDALSPKARVRQLATGMAMVFQNPASALNPSLRIGTQLTEASRVHRGLSRGQAVRSARDALARVALPSGPRLLGLRPFQLSGGMRQRIMIAMGLMTDPQVIIADEPTTALDVTVQAQILKLLATVRRERGTSILIISHDVAVMANLCDRVLIMYGGRIVEALPADRLIADAQHPYTRALIDAVPDMDTSRDRPLQVIKGIPPDPHAPPNGCPFYARCTHRGDHCATHDPTLIESHPAHAIACWFPVVAERGQVPG